MKRFGSIIAAAAMAIATAGPAMLSASTVQAASAEDLNRDSRQALETLYAKNPTAELISKRARAILIFPNVVKAGLVFGGSYGEGALMRGNQVSGYYNSVAGSWGLQAGAQSYGYAVFLMSSKALTYLDHSGGWEIGVGPTVVIVNEGTKISRINPKP
jgi:lipid-binding SYLF domain-containing protein